MLSLTFLNITKMERIRHSKTSPVDELKHYVQEELNSLEARMNERREKRQIIGKWMTRAIEDLIEGMRLLNDSNVDLALNIDNVLLCISRKQDQAQSNLVLRTRACSNPYVV